MPQVWLLGRICRYPVAPLDRTDCFGIWISRNSVIGDLDLVRVTARPASLVVMSLLAAGRTYRRQVHPFSLPSTVTVVSTVTATPTALRPHRVLVADEVERGVAKTLRDEYKISDVGP